MHELPFNVGQLAEARSFEVGFRGAWFRCKIQNIRKKKGILSYLLEYIDYPDQKLEWIKVYQKHPAQGKKVKPKSTKRQLMVRPWFPPIYPESEKSNISTISGVVVVDNAWNPGDLVDWWTDGCYWAGRVNEILESGKVKINLLPPPMGEGLTYEAFSKDIRPSLDWCPEKGWTVPVPMPMVLDGGIQRPCARLIKAEHSEDILNTDVADEIAKVVQTSISASFECSSSNSSHNTEDLDSLKGPNGVSNTTKDGTEPAVVDTNIRKTNSPDCASSSHIGAASTENMRMITVDDGLIQKKPSKKMRKDNSICLDTKFMNSIETTVLDLEELVNKVKWIRGKLEFGMPLSSSNQSFWEFCQVDAPGSKK